MKNLTASLIMALIITTGTFAQNSINFTQNGYYPEGVAYYEEGSSFLVSSMTQGEIGAVDKDGNLTSFISDDAIITPVGIKVDKEKNLLYVTNSDIGVSIKTVIEGQGKTAQLLVYDLKTKKNTATYNLANVVGDGYFFANDLAFDKAGNVYITNSFGPHIWKVASNGEASVFATNDLFNVEANHFGLNGIVYHPNGYLIVSHYAKGVLYKIPVNNPSAVEEVNLSFTPIGADGLELVDNNTLIVICNGSDGVKLNAAYTLESNDDWKSAKTSKVNPLSDAYPTTTTKREGIVYVLYGYLGKMMTGASPAISTFSIVTVIH